ncbi:MAG: DUF4307 domain-containing protein [Streptomyces sp.]|uniref:DUF4307 domain-containing protein n=1 Tax=Streptomyces sp. TaxID=1931 RepID=UPI003D6BBD28
MADVRASAPLPEGRYGRPTGGGDRDARTDRRLKITGGVLGVLALAGIGWIGVGYVSGQQLSGEMIKFKVVSDRAVEVHLEVRKDADAEGVCTLRALSESSAEVGRKDVTVEGGGIGGNQVDTVVTVRTTGRATSAELVGCAARER